MVFLKTSKLIPSVFKHHYRISFQIVSIVWSERNQIFTQIIITTKNVWSPFFAMSSFNSVVKELYSEYTEHSVRVVHHDKKTLQSQSIVTWHISFCNVLLQRAVNKCMLDIIMPTSCRSLKRNLFLFITWMERLALFLYHHFPSGSV